MPENGPENPARPKHERIKTYQSAYLEDYDFEREMVRARQKYITGLIEELRPETVIEVGCGVDLLFIKNSQLETIKRWVIVEPSHNFADLARKLSLEDERLWVYEGFFEDIASEYPLPKADLCICSSLLHEVAQPGKILDAIKNTIHENALVHINVPNATSFHRQLAYEMGLIGSVSELSQRNIALLQHTVFDRSTLCELMKSNGFEIVEEGGYFIKPFTHQQMKQVFKLFGEGIFDGLWRLGRKYPELASEIFANVRKKTL